MKEKRYNVITSVIFMCAIILPTAAWLIIRCFPKTYENLTKDIGEKRALYEISEDVSLANITAELESYYSDRVPFRNSLILADKKINGFVEKNYISKVQPIFVKCFYKESSGNKTLELYDQDSGNIAATDHDEEVIEEQEASYTSYGHKIYKCKTCGEKRWGDFTAKLVDGSFFPTTIYSGDVMLGRYGWLFYVGDRSLDYFKGDCILTEEEMRELLEKMQKLQDICDEKGITLAFMVMPNKEQVYSEYIPSKHYVSDSTDKRLSLLKKYIEDNSDITFIYPLEELKAGKMYYDTYFAHDTHWNNVGAFSGTQALYKALGIETVKLSEVEAEPYTDVMDALFATGNLDSSGFTPDIDYMLDYKNDVKVTYKEGKCDIKYGYDVYHRTKSEATDQRNFVLFGDSFRIAMIQYIEKDFASCTFAQRDISSTAKEEMRNADILVLTSVERFDGQLFEYIDTAIEYLKD